MKTKKRQIAPVLVLAVLFMALAACASAPLSPSDKVRQQDEVRSVANKTLSQLYAKNPAARDAVMHGAGYAVFSDTGFMVLFLGGAKGAGMAVNNATKKETFMKMAELEPGLGVGAAKYRLVFIFDNPAAFNTFVTSGWEAGADTMAAAKTKTSGGALAGEVTVSEGVHMYQLTEEGVIVGVGITGAKFYKDDKLN
jgi:lipid-binding SYLF domain-containing protein